MKALICRNHGLPKTLEIGEMPDPMPGPGEVLVEVSAAAMNFFDFLIIQDKYQFKPPLPFSPGGEGAGVVTALGEGVTPGENGPAIGTRVAFNSGWGAFAEQVAIPARQAYPIPDEMSFEIAAGLIITYATTIHAYKQRADLQAGETVAVLGAAGGVGLTAIELAKAMGARVIACASTDEKLAVCAEHGADAVVNYATEDLKVRLKELTDGRGVDVVYDPVGGDFSEPALRALAPKGRHLVIGFAAGDIPRVPWNLALLKEIQIVGVFWGGFTRREPDAQAENMADLFEMLIDGRIKPHLDCALPLADFEAGYERLTTRKAKGKVILRVRPEP